MAAGIVAASATPAYAIGGGVERLTVLTIHSYAGGPIIGQSWFGCPGVPQDTWGVTTGYTVLTTLPCDDRPPEPDPGWPLPGPPWEGPCPPWTAPPEPCPPGR